MGVLSPAVSRRLCLKMQRSLEGSSEPVDGDVNKWPIWGKPQSHPHPLCHQVLFVLRVASPSKNRASHMAPELFKPKRK